MKLVKTLSVKQYTELRQQAQKGELRVMISTFQPNELKSIKCYGIYANGHWIDTVDNYNEVIKIYPNNWLCN